ncbi:MAG: flagellar hook-basal body protein [Sulfurimonas sp.]|jgi:flagellar basal-body rod protein FlgG|nr:flagellar hook-basal body protein [Sulfurimonadaceae bacterium]
MQSGYYSSASGMVMQFNRMDVIANNLANVHSNGFKEENVVVGTFSRLYQQARDDLPYKNHTYEAASYINRTLDKAPQVTDKYNDFRIGTLAHSTNPLDVAIDKEGLFFLVKTPAGLRLTRDGSFSKAEDGTLVTKDGYEVLPSDYFLSNQNIRLNPEDTNIAIDKTGTIHTGSTAELDQNSQLFIAKPLNIRDLKKVGSNLYSFEDTSLENGSFNDANAIRQGFVEKSNVNAVKMMTQMIEANRMVQMYQKAMDSQMNDMNRDAIEKLSRKA